ncbi:ferrous iron transport protein B [Parapedobacter pyrenivorans]|uniref:Ferrous iron transport protein B n=1 Tax=Parapedobacter pyrenivorans TaxID=1305674 RepID=A0A917M8Y9_9SPHI|nr:ferrous iron transport protein B [Parapedobacter pyrenivorans]GGG82728.1 ferrous iron transport protein B [Parapedobacter pyrenivorans]
MTELKIALVGNPNVGKSTLFNKLTGLRQKAGNYPGVTIEKKTGNFTHQGIKYHLIDLPGAYGIHPSSVDEEVVYQVLVDETNPNHPDLVVVVGDPFNLKRAVLLYQQIREMGLPAIFVANMLDEAERAGVAIDVGKLEKALSTKVILTDARSNKGIEALKDALQFEPTTYTASFPIPDEYSSAIQQVKERTGERNDYLAWLYLSQKHNRHLDPAVSAEISTIREAHHINYHRLQVQETMARHTMLDTHFTNVVKDPAKKRENFTERLDKLLIHSFWGYIIFFALLLLIFQAIYSWSGPFMDAIDSAFAWLAASASGWFPPGPINGLLTDGIIAGIGGIVIFIPQIAMLFIFISLMEESGYMSRVVYLMDRWLKPFGLSGKSAVPLMSGAACAIPAVMSARTIENDKERLITILVTPFMTCSARLPIYIVIIGLVIPQDRFLGLELQGLVLFGMYALGVLAALGSAWVLKQLMKTNYKSFLIMEMPTYKYPVIRNVLLNVWDKTMGFVVGAGKIILAISVILWVLGSFGVSERFNNAEELVRVENPGISDEAFDNEVQSQKLEYSLLGTLGRFIEPAIEPLGYDWKMGIGLIASFAAREVFVSTMATVYSLGGTDDELTIRERMASEINPNTGRPSYNFASGISLLLFYAFAMQCMSTIAIVRKETNSWRWTVIQLAFMTGFAYFAALLAYQFLK